MTNYTWNGTNGDWNTAGDWSPNGTPGAVDTATVNSGSVDVSSIDFVGASALTVNAGGSMTIEGVLEIGGAHLNMVPNTLSAIGPITVNGGALIAGGFLTSASGTIILSNYGTFQWNGGQFVGGADASGLTVDLGATDSGTFVFSQPFNGTITDFNAGDIISYSGTGTVNSVDIVGNAAIFNTSAGTFTINFDPSVNTADFVISGNTITTNQVPCFVSGTRIRTTRGEIAVEDLRVGGLAVTSSGKARPIVWIGHRRIERPAPEAWPVRVMAGAFGDNLPVRDLFLSSGHAVCVDMAGEVFVPVGQLVNGSTIDWIEVPEVTYWHVELESHDVLLAEGMPCESYMDAGNGAFFGRAYSRLGKVDPQRVAESLARYARPFVDGGLIVEAIRERLACRAEAITPKQASKAA
ncbi:Hint domain-containing protein [Rhizobium lusitanum]|uniref:Hint domain-containing protein n=1 Tax=Rhizobium lusitanum TaxID=293958 RepID=UPI002572F4B1|nr:Hint domain-containing protein [Rhizobium lusitanum]